MSWESLKFGEYFIFRILQGDGTSNLNLSKSGYFLVKKMKGLSLKFLNNCWKNKISCFKEKKKALDMGTLDRTHYLGASPVNGHSYGWPWGSKWFQNLIMTFKTDYNFKTW